MAEKTHIRVRIPIQFDAVLERSYPHLAGPGKAEARLFIAIDSWMRSRGVDVPVAPRPAALDLSDVRRPGASRMTVQRMPEARVARMRKARRR